MKKGNIYSDLMQDKYGEYYIGYTNNTNLEFYIDAENFEEVKKYTWYSFVRNNMIGIRARINGEKILLHQFLGFKNYDHIDRNELNNRKYNLRKCTHQENCMNRGKYSNNTSGITGVYFIKSNSLLGFENYDHIDRNPLNNRKENLRAATTAENSRNRNISKNNTSGIIGVGLNKKNGKWRARITFEQNEIFLGEYIKKEDAIITRLKAEKKYFGEFAPQQYLYKEYNIE